MKSFALLKTNPKLTTNIQIVVDSNYDLFLESFDSNELLSDNRFKKQQFSKYTPFDKLIPNFFKGFEAKSAYHVKFDDDKSEMFNDFSKQFDDIYNYGCSNVKDTNYLEEFECSAPLHFDIDSIPTSFIIFRVDGPGLITLTKDNFISEIIDKLKVVKYFDLTTKTDLGEWLENFKTPEFPKFKMEIDVRKSEFSNWSGIDFDNGGYTEKSLFMKDILESETSFFEMDRILTDFYENNKLVYPNILNFKFLFDDTPATKTSLRKWSINRYYGFYCNSVESVKTVTPFSNKELIPNIAILDDNIITSDPFVDGFVDGDYIEYNGEFYTVVRLGNMFKIISPFDLKGLENDINSNTIEIDSNNVINYNNKYNQNIFEINGFAESDVWIIDIDGMYHVIKKVNNDYVINTDYSFNINNNKLKYWINESDDTFTTTVDLSIIDKNNPPMSFNIYRVNFTDIKEFDTNIINTGYARYEYESRDTISNSLEPKMFVTDMSSNTNPKEFDEYIFNNELVKIPASSEYVATNEVFEIVGDEDLSDIWRKNAIFCKWGFDGSVNNGDYPYRFNNSFYGEDMNKSVNIYDPIPNRIERNLDYFYTINPDSISYIDHTLHVSGYSNNELDPNFSFEMDKYFNVGTVSCVGTSSYTYSNDYFDYFFTKKEFLDNNNLIRNTKKYSTFLPGDDSIANITLFRGLLFKIYTVDKILTNADQNGKIGIESISIKQNNNFDKWKFSILLSDTTFDIDDPNFKTDPQSTITYNNMQWDVLDVWKLETEYPINDTVLYTDIIYTNISGTSSTIDDPSIHPGNSIEWTVATFSSPFFNPIISYTLNDWVFNSGEYYNNISATSNGDFFNHGLTYSIGDIVIYKNNNYVSSINNNISIPSNPSWTLTNNSPRWNKIEQWSGSLIYSISEYVYYNGSLYISDSNNNMNNIPTISNWTFVYSFVPDDKIYNSNDVIEMNNRYYLLLSNINNDKLDNGINVYINKKWKNVFVNIYINDNTTINIKNKNRDILYSDINQKLTANSFIESLNYLDDKKLFANYINYYVIEEDLSHKKYNINNILELPIILSVEDPDGFEVILDSLIKEKIDRDIVAKKSLNDNEINDISQLDYYNGNPLGIKISKSTDLMLNNKTNRYTMYRFNGNYSPIFNNIEIFKNPDICDSDIGNYLFDTELTDFGTSKEVIISKVNLIDNVFKLKDSPSVNSIYPQIDEFGYTTTSHFIFKSTWDNKYYTKVS